MRRRTLLGVLFIALAQIPITELSAQIEIRLHMDRLTAVGDFRDEIQGAWGGGLSGTIYGIYGKGSSNIGLRVDAAAALLGKESRRVPLSASLPSNLDVSVATTSSAFRVATGPQIVFSRGRFRPYAFGTIGVSHFSTRTSVTGAETTISSNAHGSHTGVVSTLGGGTMIDLRRREKLAIGLFVEAAYQINGTIPYLSAQDAHPSTMRDDGPVPVEVAANVMATSIGVTIRGLR